MLAVTSPLAPGQMLNIGCGKAYSLLELISTLNSILKTCIEPEFQPERVGDIKHSLADIVKAKEILGYEPVVSFETGLTELVKSML